MTSDLSSLGEYTIVNPMYSGGHCYKFDESICHFREVASILSLLFYFGWKILLANNVGPDQMPQYVGSDQGLHSLPLTLFTGIQI